MRVVLSHLLVAGVTLTLPPLTSAANYTFTNIVDSSGPFNTFDNSSINNAGTVAFVATLDAGARGVFTGSGGSISTVADTSGMFSFFPSQRPVINSGGVVAFVANMDAGGSGIFANSSGVISTIADDSGPSYANFDFLSINTGGTVAFRCALKPGNAGYAIVTGTGGALTEIARSNDTLKSLFPPDINASGTVVFSATIQVSSGSPQGVFIGNGGAITTVADSNGPFNSLGENPSINDAGTVAFKALPDAGGQGIFTSNGGLTSTIADSSGAFNIFEDTPSINMNGTVAFFAYLDAGGSGIFTGPNAVADKVIKPGDVLFGSTVTAIHFYNNDLNDNGDIAFQYGLSNGKRGIAVAHVPEANGVAMLAVTSAVFSLVRRRKS